MGTFKHFVSGGIVGLLACCALAACSKPTSGTTSVLHCPVSTNNFALSLVSTAGGANSPVAAANAISGHEMAGMPGFRLPSSGWVVVHQGSNTASVRSGNFQLHAVKGTDGSWEIDSGYHCLSPSIGPSHASSTSGSPYRTSNPSQTRLLDSSTHRTNRPPKAKDEHGRIASDPR